ncbi:uncharacterized protein LOC129778160 isoform X2 [Toxorhynchites rutilus septentrionalis]|nr:uncharacterized protein LOC129778160 isoform X2 [Toxorhynchites rutilus septentrionalis]
MQRSVVQICNHATASGQMQNLPHYSPAVSNRPGLGCFNVLLIDLKTDTRRLAHGCTNNVNFCSAWNASFVSVRQCSVCPGGDPDEVCNPKQPLEDDMSAVIKFGKLTATEGTTLGGQSEDSASGAVPQENSTEITISHQSSPMTTKASQTSTEELGALINTINSKPTEPLDSGHGNASDPEELEDQSTKQSNKEHNKSSNVTPAVPFIVATLIGAAFCRS